jgi:hypothetical protein
MRIVTNSTQKMSRILHFIHKMLDIMQNRAELGPKMHKNTRLPLFLHEKLAWYLLTGYPEKLI